MLDHLAGSRLDPNLSSRLADISKFDNQLHSSECCLSMLLAGKKGWLNGSSMVHHCHVYWYELANICDTVPIQVHP